MLSGVCTQERDNNMKRKLVILSAVICVLGLMLTGCAKETEKADNGHPDTITVHCRKHSLMTLRLNK